MGRGEHLYSNKRYNAFQENLFYGKIQMDLAVATDLVCSLRISHYPGNIPNLSSNGSGLERLY